MGNRTHSASTMAVIPQPQGIMKTEEGLKPIRKSEECLSIIKNASSAFQLQRQSGTFGQCSAVTSPTKGRIVSIALQKGTFWRPSQSRQDSWRSWALLDYVT